MIYNIKIDDKNEKGSPKRIVICDLESLIEMIFADTVYSVGGYYRVFSSNFIHKHGIRTEINNLLQDPVFDGVFHYDEFPFGKYTIKDFGRGSLQKVFDEIRKRILNQYIEEEDLFSKMQTVIPDCDRKLFNIIIRDYYEHSFWVYNGKYPIKTYYEQNIFDDIVAQYRTKFPTIPPRKNVSSIYKCDINAAGYLSESHQIRDVRVHRDRVSWGDFSNIEFCISRDTLSQTIEIQLYADLSQRQYIPCLNKKVVLKKMMKSFIKLHKDLEKQQKSKIPNPKREAKIKSIIMNQVTTLKQQSGYFKQYFNKNVDIIVERYRRGDFMSVAELEACFDLSDKPVCPKVIPGNHGIIR